MSVHHENIELANTINDWRIFLIRHTVAARKNKIRPNFSGDFRKYLNCSFCRQNYGLLIFGENPPQRFPLAVFNNRSVSLESSIINLDVFGRFLVSPESEIASAGFTILIPRRLFAEYDFRKQYSGEYLKFDFLILENYIERILDAGFENGGDEDDSKNLAVHRRRRPLYFEVL